MTRARKFLTIGLIGAAGTLVASVALGQAGGGWSDRAGMGSEALGSASSRAIATYSRQRNTYVPCMRTEIVWRPFPFFGYQRVRLPC